jgi:hypothetical protein
MLDIIKKSIDEPKIAFKYLLSPSKTIKFIEKKYFSLPSLNFLEKIKKKIIKKFIVFFWLFFSKRNKNIKFFFFEKNEPIEKIYFEKEEINSLDNSKSALNSLAYNGIIVIENALPQSEHNLIQNYFLKLENVKDAYNKNHWEQIPKIYKTESKLRIVSSKKIHEFNELSKLSSFFSKKVYGKDYKNNAEFYLDKALRIPEDKVKGDNFIHIDRYVPNMKILYYPFEINLDNAPFTYCLGSHKINKNYTDFVLKGLRFDETEEGSDFFLKNKKKITAKENSLVITLTSGFHGRSSFNKLKSRMIVFLQFASYNKLSLIRI